MSRKRWHYWPKKENAIAEAINIMKKEKWSDLPGGNVLIEKGYSGLVHAIISYHGGMMEFRNLLGLKQRKAPNGSLSKLSYVIAQAKKVMKEKKRDKLPPLHVLSKEGYSSLAYAICKYHGGSHKFRRLLGQDQNTLPRGQWESLEFALKEARKAMKEQKVNELPPSNRLREIGYNSLALAISRYHGGFHKFRTLLGQKQKITVAGMWKNLDYTIEQAVNVMKKENCEKLPDSEYLRERGYNGLIRAIYKYHGGFPHFRQILEGRRSGRSERERLESLLTQYAHGGIIDG